MLRPAPALPPERYTDLSDDYADAIPAGRQEIETPTAFVRLCEEMRA